MPRRPNSAREILSQNAQLLARLQLAERLAAEREAALQALHKEVEQLKSERTHYVERVVLLEEELRWMKAQYFGTSSQRVDAAAANPDQAMLFNEAEVLAAIEAAEQADCSATIWLELRGNQDGDGCRGGSIVPLLFVGGKSSFSG